MKIDVEGAEISVLQGAERTLATARPILFIEVHSSALLSRCTSLLATLGYRIEHLDNDMSYARQRDVFQVRAVSADNE